MEHRPEGAGERSRLEAADSHKFAAVNFVLAELGKSGVACCSCSIHQLGPPWHNRFIGLARYLTHSGERRLWLPVDLRSPSF